jgi:hypothetical protein
VLAGLIALRWSIAGVPTGRDSPKSHSSANRQDLSRVNVERTPVDTIPAGTVIGDSAPEGWTHLIYTSAPVLSEEDLERAPSTASFYAQLFRYVLLAKVSKADDSFRLAEVAAGFAVDIQGEETIIDSRNTCHARLGLFGKRILSENEKAFRKDVQQVAATDTMRLIDDRQMVRQGKEHVKMVIRHAILVDPRTGRLWTFVWLLSDKDGQLAPKEKAMQLLPEGLHEKYRVSVKPDAFGLMGMPSEESFARYGIPQGQAISFTPELEKQAALAEFTPEQVVKLEKALREAAQAAGKP